MQEELSICPSFSSYSSGNLTQVAIKISEQFRSTEAELQIGNNNEHRLNDSSIHGVADVADDDDDFEFARVRTDLDDTSVPAADRIRPIFPVFDRDLLLDDVHEVRDGDFESRDVSVIRGLSLKNLFIEERDIPSSSSSSEADELDSVAPTTYCVWSPEASPGRCKKSNSTGSSSKSTKRWRFRDLLRRSSSDGKDPFVFLTPSAPTKTTKEREAKPEKGHEKTIRRSSGEVKVAGKTKANEVAAGKKLASAHEVFYVRNRAMKDSEKRRSYLPYKQDIVGLFASNVNGLSLTKSFAPF